MVSPTPDTSLASPASTLTTDRASDPNADPNAGLRKSLYLILIVLALGNMTGRLLSVNNVEMVGLEAHLHRQGRTTVQLQRPFLSANDRSRWCTIRALVDEGTYTIDNIHVLPNWDTIDKVKHDGHYYSSKPPLMPTLLAGLYWIIQCLTGWTLAERPHSVVRLMLFLTQILPLGIAYYALAQFIERYGRTDFGRLFTFAGLTCGTFLNTFAITLNNHVFGTICVIFAIAAALPIWADGHRQPWRFAAAGFWAAFAAANELPALAFLGLLGLALLWLAPRETLSFGLPAALVVAVAFFGTNYLAHERLAPAYAQKEWYEFEYVHKGKIEKSYFSNPQGIDRGEPSRAVYALHVLVGHHGIFSLTPLWLLVPVGWFLAFRSDDRTLRALSIFTIILSVTVIAFYLSRGLHERNYGGMTSGFRWAFWLIPLWTLCLLPAADACRTRTWTQALALGLLGLSVLSISYPIWNPWTHPWLYHWFWYEGWIS